jgi:hypothetical protein
MGRHKQPEITPAQVDAIRVQLLEEQVRRLSIDVVQAAAEHRAQAAIIRRRNTALLGMATVVVQLLTATVRPEPVLDTGTPGVEVTPS